MGEVKQPDFLLWFSLGTPMPLTCRLRLPDEWHDFETWGELNPHLVKIATRNGVTLWKRLESPKTGEGA